MTSVAIIDYGAGNLRSAQKAFLRAAGESGTEVIVTADPDRVRKANRIVLPGVGAFADCMAGLRALDGMIATLEDRVLKRGVPFLGICVGMQLLATLGREKTETPGLGWITGTVGPITPADRALKVPHMGWNTIDVVRPHVLFETIPTGPDGLHAYFVHSYQMQADKPEDVIATAQYGGPITAAIGRDNIFGTQFHPEKSQALGLALISNFLKWRP